MLPILVNMLVHASLCHSGVSTTHYGEICKVTDVLAPSLSIMVNVSVMLLTIYKAWYVYLELLLVSRGYN